jgi:hypothetical protein
VSENTESQRAELRAALVAAAKMEDLAERSLEVVAVIDAAGAPLGIHPVMVGGMAVYFWTADEAFVTRDIDVVMPVPERLAAALADLRAVQRRVGHVLNAMVELAAEIDAGRALPESDELHAEYTSRRS